MLACYAAAAATAVAFLALCMVEEFAATDPKPPVVAASACDVFIGLLIGVTSDLEVT